MRLWSGQQLRFRSVDRPGACERGQRRDCAASKSGFVRYIINMVMERPLCIKKVHPDGEGSWRPQALG